MVPDVLAVNLDRRAALLDTGEEISICSMFDCFGEATDDPTEALSLAMGPDTEGNWYAAPVSAFAGMTH